MEKTDKCHPGFFLALVQSIQYQERSRIGFDQLCYNPLAIGELEAAPGSIGPVTERAKLRVPFVLMTRHGQELDNITSEYGFGILAAGDRAVTVEMCETLIVPGC